MRALDLNKVREIPLNNEEAVEIPSEFISDPMVVARRLYEINK